MHFNALFQVLSLVVRLSNISGQDAAKQDS